MSDNDCDYVKDMRARFEENKNQSHALMIEVLADNKRFIGYLNYLGICPHDGSPTAEEIVGMRIQGLQRTNARFEQSLKKIEEAAKFLMEVKDHKDANGKDDWYEDVQPIAWQQLRKALSNLS
ncbi:MAG: hypothetical protein KAR42_17975 [candidate division Zixibacteria bacterium]|nr:hypothetical protein [candidate division Zixibacteria bacterium]